MRKIHVSEIQKAVEEGFSRIAFSYEPHTREMLVNATHTDNERELDVLSLLLENEKLAIENHVPLCQDTGLAIVYLKIGQEVMIEGPSLKQAINQGVRDAYKKHYLRYSVVDDPLFERKNTKDNTPALIHYEIVDGDGVELDLMAKGAGSENCSKVYMMKPSDGVEGVKEFVLATIKEKAANACPPISVGVGIGGNLDTCCWLAKKALIRENDFNPDSRYQALEKELLDAINEMNIGPAGLHGHTTAIRMAIEACPTHIASLPVAININCHAVRKTRIVL